jgi:hypothetical protein
MAYLFPPSMARGCQDAAGATAGMGSTISNVTFGDPYLTVRAGVKISLMNDGHAL